MSTKVFLADNNFIVKEGFKAIVNGADDLEFAGEASNSAEFFEMLEEAKPDLLVIDYSSTEFRVEDIQKAREILPELKILAITTYVSQGSMLKAIENGITGYILKDCDRDEVVDAIYSTAKGENFFCGKIITSLMNEDKNKVDISLVASCCEPMNVSKREKDIIKLIAMGFSNKEIGEKLFLSTHTVSTHRKNIMSKLGVNNAAGVVVYAIKENIISPE
jgi:DNA-binding NarL/FixJ family response regulator